MKYKTIGIKTELPIVNLSGPQDEVLFNLMLHIVGDLRCTASLDNVNAYLDVIKRSIDGFIYPPTDDYRALSDGDINGIVGIANWVFLRSFVPEHQCPVKLAQFNVSSVGYYFLYQSI